MKFKEGDKVIFEGDTYDFGYISQTGRAVIYEEGERNMQDSIAVELKDCKKPTLFQRLFK